LDLKLREIEILNQKLKDIDADLQLNKERVEESEKVMVLNQEKLYAKYEEVDKLNSSVENAGGKAVFDLKVKREEIE